MDRLLYNEKINEENIFLLHNVAIDNMTIALTKAFGVSWSYEIIHEDQSGKCAYMTVQLHVPGRSLTGVSAIEIEPMNKLTYRQDLLKMAIHNAVTMGFPAVDADGVIIEEPKEAPAETVKPEVALSTLDELDALCEEKPKEPVKPQSSKVPSFRDDQLSFLNKFKEDYKVDTDKKFDHYVKAWNETCRVGVTTKKELVMAGPEVLDGFIKWIASLEKGYNFEPKEIASPI